MRSPRLVRLALLASSSFAACQAPVRDGTEPAVDTLAQPILSDAARILDFRFTADVIAPGDMEARKAIVSQLMYVQGQLTMGHKANGQVGNVRLEGVHESPSAEGSDGRTRVRYTATMPVAWPKDRSVPESFELVLPRDLTETDAFDAKYDGRCGRHEWDTSTFWHDWNPAADGCTIDEGDVTRASVAIGPSARAGSDRYPEYDLIWGDGKLTAVAVFGIITSDAHDDWGYTGAKSFTDHVTRKLSSARERARTVEHETTSSVLSDVTVTGRSALGDVQVDVILVRDLSNFDGDFDARYDDLSEKADLVLYNGHAGLGRNVNTFARKGRVAAGKYQLMLMNGCQTFAYLDTTLTDRRREANGSADPQGTRYLDVMANALPGYANNLAKMSGDVFDAMVDRPTSYGELLGRMPASHVVVVFGEEDNRFTP